MGQRRSSLPTRRFIFEPMSRLQRSVHRELEALMAASGRPEVRRAHIAALAHIPRGTGIRMSLLADRLGVTKGAATQLVAHLERCGYLERLPDPSDGRAVIVRPTQAADAGYELARQRLADLEEGWERHVGTPRWQVFKDVLEEIANLQDRAAATVHPD